MKKQTGSSMKPLAVIAPGLEEKVITASTVYLDVKTRFSGNYEPVNYNSFTGKKNIREFIKTSQNIPAVKIMAELTPKKSVEYLNKMGIKSLNEEDEILATSIGGVHNGISPLEMAVAYGTIANDGVYITPTFYTKVVDSNGNTVLTPNQEKTRVISEQNAYITKSILQEPVSSGGTATYCAISGMDVAAKTGTTDDTVDRWLCGFTPYYSAATWYGYDTSETVVFSGNPAGKIWSAVMKNIHKGLTSAKFTKPSGIVEASVCRVTGGLATSGCGSTYTEIFTADNMPEKCEGHGSQTICKESGKIANEYCPKDQLSTNYYGGTLPKEETKLWTNLSGGQSSGTKITETCTIHKKPEEKPKENDTTNNTNTTNSTNTSNSNSNKTNNKNNTNSSNTTNSTNTNSNKPSTNTSTNTSTNQNKTP